MSLLDTASLVVTPNGTKASKLYSVVPSSGAGDLDVTRATTATRVNSSGLIESVASNVPRLDYTNGSCPSILVEPQRTNLLLRSQEIDNVAWVRNASPTITANASISPDGTLNADNFSTTASASGVYQVPAVISGGTYTFSVYIKNISNATNIRIGCDLNPSTGFVDYNAVTNTIYSTGGSIISSSVESAGNGWYKIKASYNTTGIVNTFIIFSLSSSTFNYSIWGAQLEAGSYATSYIPTTSASVTRNADVISKTGISSIFGTNQGTLFCDFLAPSVDNSNTQYIFDVSDGTNGTINRLAFYKTPSGYYQLFTDAGTNVTINYNTRNKVAIVWNGTNVKIYANGTQQANITYANTNPSKINLGSRFTNVEIGKVYFDVFATWETALTNTQLAQLTTI